MVYNSSVNSDHQKHTNLIHPHLMLFKISIVFFPLGYDVIIDQDLKPWLLEVNASPSLTANTKEDYMMKTEMLHGMLDVIDMEVSRTTLQCTTLCALYYTAPHYIHCTTLYHTDYNATTLHHTTLHYIAVSIPEQTHLIRVIAQNSFSILCDEYLNTSSLYFMTEHSARG